MPQLTLEMNIEEIRDLIFKLPLKELLTLVEAIEERAETVSMMSLADSGFAEWNDEGEIYTMPKPSRGEVWLVRFPFTDLTATKHRNIHA